MFFRSVGSLFFMWERGTLLNEDFRAVDEAAVTKVLIHGPGENSVPGLPHDTPVPDILVLTGRPDIVVADRRARLRSWTQRLRAAGIVYYAHYFVTSPLDDSGGTSGN